MLLPKTQPRNRGMKFSCIHQDDECAVTRACRNRIGVKFSQQRVIEPTGRDAAER